MRTLLFRRPALLGSLLWLLMLALPARADKLTIYHVGVGQGDATIIMAQQSNKLGGIDTTTILIDAGNSSGKGTAVVTALQQLLGKRKVLDLAIVSHLHSDHLGGSAQLLNTLKANGWWLTAIIDRGVNYTPLDDECYSDEGYVDNDPVAPVDLPGSGVYKTYVSATEAWGKIRFNIAPGAELFTSLGRPGSISMTCVASNSSALTTYGSAVAAPYPAHDENDYSFAFLIEFQGFKYFTGGDIGGGGGGHGDGETPLASYFATYPNPTDFHFCNFKVSHHGSAYSTNPAFLTRAKPSYVVIPSALRTFSGTQIPTASTISALQKVCGELFTTYVFTSSISSGSVSNYIDVRLDITDPSYGQAIPMTVSQYLRSKSSPYGLLGQSSSKSVSCSQNHPAPSLGRLAESERREPTVAQRVAPALRTQRAARTKAPQPMLGSLRGYGPTPASR